MAFDPKDIKRNVESFEADVANLGKQLSKITKDYEKAISSSIEKTRQFPKNWSDAVSKIKESIIGTNSLNDKLNAGRTKQIELNNKISSIAEKRRSIESTINKIGQESLSIINNAKSQNRSVSVEEKARLKILSDSETSLSNSSNQLLKHQRYLSGLSRDQKKQNEQVSKEVKGRETILKILNFVKEVTFAIIKAGERYDKVLMDAAYEVGVGRIEIEKYVPAINKAVTANMALGATFVDGYKAANQLVNQFELMSVQLQDGINQQMLVMNKAFGVSLEDSAKFFSTLTQIGNATLSSQENMVGVADAAAKAAGVPIGKVLKDVSNLSNSVRLIFKGNTVELIKQAAEARKLGSSLDSAAKSAERLLEFEASIGSELKLSALLGKNVNFNESRRLFFAGKIVEGEKALIRELERVGDINDLNYLQRKELSNLTGKDLSELQKIQTQRKQQLEIDSKFPEVAEERKRAETELAKILGSETEQRKRALEIQARDNIANTRRNVLAQLYEQILINISRALQPLYRILTLAAEAILKVGITITNWIADISNANKWIGITVGSLLILTVGIVSLGVAIVGLVAIFGLLSVVGIEISAFLTEIGIGLAAFGVGALTVVPIVLSIAAALAAVGVAAYGIGKAFEGIGILIKSILDPIVSLIQIVLTQFNVFTSNIGKAMTEVASGMKLIADIGLVNISKAAAGIYLLANSIGTLSISMLLFPIKKFTDFIEKIGSIKIDNLNIFDKVLKIIELANLNGGNINLNLNVDESILTRLENLTKKPLIFLQDGIIDILNKVNTASLKLIVEKDSLDILNKLNNTGLKLSVEKDSFDILNKITNNLISISLEKTSLDVLSNFGNEKINSIITSVESMPEEAKKFSIEISDDAKDSINKLADLKSDNQDLKNVIQDGDNKIVAGLQQLISLMSNGGISVNLDGQLVSRTLATTAYKSGGFGQSTTRA